MFEKILVANRGEIALRVIRAARELGIATVAVHSTADADSLHVKFADESVCIGPPSPTQSYLSIPAIIAAAEVTAADAIHPGYGFLSENAAFADAVRACGFTFIGPSGALIRLMGDKIRARRAMREQGLPILPGTEEAVRVEDAHELAGAIGFPLIVKAAAGGGGRGMKIVRERSELKRALLTAHKEAAAAFGNGTLYLERYVERPRHIEFQVLADHHGRVVHLGERECSVQRRHQKLVEESPSPALDPARRAELGARITTALTALGYTNAGTVEMIMDEAGELYFMEMNTRIQVEHPVTEAVTGLDLVRLQIQIAAGQPLPFGQADVVMRGHAIECRINAEDPITFAPSPGEITGLHLPGGLGIRTDTAITQDSVVHPYYDSMIAKLIVHDRDRPAAIARMTSALRELIVEGIRTNVSFHERLCARPEFTSGRYDTGLVANMQRDPLPPRSSESSGAREEDLRHRGLRGPQELP